MSPILGAWGGHINWFGLVIRNDLRHFLKKERLYPLVASAANRILVACLKSHCCVQILWKRSNCDLISPANVCFGWKLVLNSRACVSVGLKNTFTSNLWSVRKFGPLNVVVSRKSILVLWNVDLSFIEALWPFRVFRNPSKSCSEWCHIPQMSSRNL